MDSFRFRPQVTDLEDRLVPATPAELFALSHQVAEDRAAIAALTGSMNKPRSVFMLSRFAENLAERVQRNGTASGTFLETYTQIQTVIAANPVSAPSFAAPGRWLLTNASQAVRNMLKGAEVLGRINLVLDKQDAPIPPSAQLPAPPTPPAPPPPPSQTGQQLSDTIPPLNAPEWQTIGNQGLRFWDVVPGTGATVQASDTIRVHYVGWLTDGTVFDSSVERGQPLESPLSGLIQGWQQGIPGMKVGGIRRLDIPASLAYGAAGSPPSIPPNARLVFEFQMLSTTQGSTPPTNGSGTTLSQEQIQQLLNQQSAQ